MNRTKIEYLDYTKIKKRHILKFWDTTQIGNLSECWEWRGSCNAYGYGQISIGGRISKKNYRAHRLSWMITYGVIPKNLFVLHKCDNRKCVNPFHLFLGTQRDNIKDCFTKGRSRGGSLKGEENPNCKLNAIQVSEIRNRYNRGGIYQFEIAEIYGITQAQVSSIIRGESWRQQR